MSNKCPILREKTLFNRLSVGVKVECSLPLAKSVAIQVGITFRVKTLGVIFELFASPRCAILLGFSTGGCKPRFHLG